MRVEQSPALRWENMLAGIRAQGPWLADGPEGALREARDLLAGPAPSRIYLVGCGDSHYCGLAGRLAFETWTGIPTEPLPSLSFSRYVVGPAPSDAWVVCVSNSGRAARTVEAARVARERGLRTIGITFAPDSPLADAAETTITFDYPDPGFGPGTVSYVASLGVLYAVALRTAELAGRLTYREADVRIAEVASHRAAVEATVELAEAAEALGRGTALDTPITILGGGPSFGTASFGAAKLREAARVAAGVQELEEWAHEEFFSTGPGTLTIVVTPSGAADDRAVEQLRAVREVGGTAVAVCRPSNPAAAAADDVLPVASYDVNEALSPLAYCVPLELFALHFASSKGLTMFGFDDEQVRRINHRQIFVD